MQHGERLTGVRINSTHALRDARYSAHFLPDALHCYYMTFSLREWARSLKLQTVALYFAARDPRTPITAKLFAATIVAYALSPIDLIPDFIPVLGYLDDIVIIPLWIWLALKLIPDEVMVDARARAQQLESRRLPRSYLAAVIIAMLWVAVVSVFGLWIYHRFLSM